MVDYGYFVCEVETIMERGALTMALLGVGSAVASTIYTFMFIWSGERMAMKIRRSYFKALLKQGSWLSGFHLNVQIFFVHLLLLLLSTVVAGAVRARSSYE